MKKISSIVAALAVAFTSSLNAQTNTFTVTPPAPVTVTVPTTSTTTVSTLHVQFVLVDAVHQKITVKFVETPAPVVITGAAFTAFQSQFQGSFATAITAYLASQSH